MSLKTSWHLIEKLLYTGDILNKSHTNTLNLSGNRLIYWVFIFTYETKINSYRGLMCITYYTLSTMYYLISSWERVCILCDAIMYISELNPLNLKITVLGQRFRIQYYVKKVGRETPSAI